MSELEPGSMTERVLRLGRVPPLNRLTTAELELLASAGREVLYTKRTLLVPADERAMAFYVALTGRLTAVRGGQPVPGDPIREFYGASAMVGDAVLAADIVAEPGTVLFVLDRDAFFAVLEEHGALQRSLLRIMSLRVLELRKGGIVTSGVAIGEQRSDFPVSDLLFRMRLFRDALGLESRSLPVLAQLVRSVHFRQTSPGGVLWDGSNVPANVVVALRGAIDAGREGTATTRLRPIESVGLTEAVAGVPMAFEGLAVGETTTVELKSAELQEAIEDHDDFCLDLFRVMAHEMHRLTLASSVVAHA
jgi:CRP-like cAMP-binding protein